MGELVVYPLLVLALLSSGTSVLVYRADPGRNSNRFFALMSGLDALTQWLRAVYVLAGHPLNDSELLAPCFYGSVLVSASSILFAYSFPFDEALPRRLALPLLGHVLLAIAMTLHPRTQLWFYAHANAIYFIPQCAVALYLLRRNFRRLKGGQRTLGIPLIMGAVALRWASSMAIFTVARPLSQEWFSVLLHLDATLVYAACYVAAAYGMLKDQLFHVRGALAEAFLYGGMVLFAVALSYVGIELTLTTVPSATAQRVYLLAIAGVPVLTVLAGARLARLAERSLLGPMHPRRAQARSTLEEALAKTASVVDREILTATAASALAEMTGAEVQCLGASRGPRAEAALSPALEAHFAALRPAFLLPERAYDLSSETERALAELAGKLYLPIRRAGVLYGVFVVRGGEIDRDVVESAVALAGHLALKLEHATLFEEMLRLKGELDESRRLAELGAFAAAIAHDIRTPLTSVQMNVQILQRKAQLPPTDMEYFDIALEELRRLSAHVSELLDYAKPPQLCRAALDLGEWVEEAAKNMEPLLKDRKLVLVREHEAALPNVQADGERLRQVLQNLVDNAAQASTQGSAIHVITRRAEDGRAVIEVADQGKGIAPENMERIFEPFFTTRADGTGLGLAIARKLVRAHGGEIKVSSRPGGGARFSVLLPVEARG